MACSRRSNFQIFSACLSILLLFSNQLTAQDQGRLVMIDTATQKIKFIKEGKYLSLISNNTKYQGRLDIQDTLNLTLDTVPIAMSDIAKLREGHVGLNLTKGALAGLLLVTASFSTGLLLYEATQQEDAAMSVVCLVISVPMAILTAFSFKITLNSIRKIIWTDAKRYRLKGEF